MLSETRAKMVEELCQKYKVDDDFVEEVLLSQLWYCAIVLTSHSFTMAVGFSQHGFVW